MPQREAVAIEIAVLEAVIDSLLSSTPMRQQLAYFLEFVLTPATTGVGKFILCFDMAL